VDGLQRDAATAADVHGLKLAALQELIGLGAADAEGLGGSARGVRSGLFIGYLAETGSAAPIAALLPVVGAI